MPPAKRPRHDSLLDEQKPSVDATVTRSENIWLRDGNVILRAEITLFKVHQSILAIHSAVFRDMFELPQPSSVQDEMLEGCIVLRLQDSTRDVNFMLDFFYGKRRVPTQHRYTSCLIICSQAIGGHPSDGFR
jgi:hypothetical protein